MVTAELHHPWGMGFCVRPYRFALTLATIGTVDADVLALHECDDPVFVKVSGPGALREQGWQGHNSTTCGVWRAPGAAAADQQFGAWHAMRGGPRSVALREAVQSGVWDAGAVANALLGAEPRLF
jgi:hypothetical protein